MASLSENERTEYAALMSRGRDAERTSHFCWIASGIAATVLMSWAIAARRPAPMLPVVFAVAYGFYTTMHGRQQTRLIAGYVKEFFEGRDTGPQWFTRLAHLETVPGFSPSMSDWLATSLANVVVLAAIVFAWLFAPAAPRGELYAGIVTGCGIAFAIHSILETTRLRQSDAATSWRQVRTAPAEDRRPARVVVK
ncbi:MAG: hypothetical protein E6K76_05555 [Candidatus Eisenbacteria bacterium]|uniref:Uncharacterized protein n=1 Tax=Eiseniibacteriota bacterium TaxID=2212470 RepID=A0A538T6C5_UNCEI|nr:MAG: hypothetical protein E6K76_05555 [Candidatus Eisenbacteria bacterium]